MFTVGLDTSALDAEFKEHAARGIGRYVGELKNFFLSNTPDASTIEFFDHRDFHAPRIVDRAVDLLPAGRNTIKMQLIYPFQLNRNGTRRFDVLHFPAHMDAPSWSPKDYIITVLDLIPLVCEDLYRADRAGFRFEFARWLEKRAIINSSLVIAISENTARDVNRILGVPLEKIFVTPLGVDKKFFERSDEQNGEQIRSKYGLTSDEQVVLYVGGIDQRKNIHGMLETFRELVNRFAQASRKLPSLLMVGRIDRDRQYPKLLSKIEQLELQQRVKFTGFVDDLELMQLYGLSSAFFFPSLYEGFGLPPLEALATGTPVVSSNTSAMPEVLGEAALLVDPTDPRQCAQALERVLVDSHLAASLREQGPKQAAKFSWQRTGELTLRAYEHYSALR